jgi:uncharacterized phage protein (TIGR01671 family)
MKDRFKFRAWCKVEIDKRWEYAYDLANKMCNIDSLRDEYGFDRVFDINQKLIQRYFRKWSLENSKEDRYNYHYEMRSVGISSDGKVIASPNVEVIALRQCTGLKDKNGKVIFEGDILKKDHREQFYVVEFCKKGHFAGAFCLKNTESGKFAGFSQESIFMPSDAPRNWDEVIGNIHQNPELIKGE